METSESMIRVFVAGVETALEASNSSETILDLPAQDDARLGPSGLLPKLFYPERDSLFHTNRASNIEPMGFAVRNRPEPKEQSVQTNYSTALVQLS